MTISQPMNIRNLIVLVVLAIIGTLAQAQLYGNPHRGDSMFLTKGLDDEKIPSQRCAGFYKTPGFKCEDIKVPAYFARVKGGDRKALVVILPGAGGLDKRHSEYRHEISAAACLLHQRLFAFRS